MNNDDPARVAPRPIRRVIVTLAGGLITAVGTIMLFLPPLPGLLVTASGLGLLSTEYAWARRLKQSVEMRLQRSGRDVGAESPVERPGDVGVSPSRRARRR